MKFIHGSFAMLLAGGCTAVLSPAPLPPWENVARIASGMSADEVEALIGPPLRRQRFERSDTTAWDYRIRDSIGCLADYAVTFDNRLRVVSTANIRLDRLGRSC